MKAGRIVVAAGGASGALEPLTTLGPGEAFGEIALLSGERRIALGIPIARGMTEAMGYGRQSPRAAAVGLLTFFAVLEIGELFMTGTFTGLVVHDLRRRPRRRRSPGGAGSSSPSGRWPWSGW